MAEQVGLAAEYHAWMYLATLCGAIPGVAILVRRRREVDDPRPLLALTVVLTVLGLIVALGAVSLTLLGVGAGAFSSRALRPSRRFSPRWCPCLPPCRCGVPLWAFFSSAQFFGCVFTGGVLGGSALQLGGTLGLVAVLLGLTAIWLLGFVALLVGHR